MSLYDEILKKLVKYADESEQIMSLIIFGSRARTEQKADNYSDYDIILLVKDVDYFINTDLWLKEIDEYYISFHEMTVASGKERRIFFRDGYDMDFLFYDYSDKENLAKNSIIQSWFLRGYQVIIDKIEFKEDIKKYLPTNRTHQLITESDYINLVNTFWFHAIWSIKKICRGELWSAKRCIDGYMKELLRNLIEINMKAVNGKEFDTWHDGRFFDELVDNKIIEQLRYTYGEYDNKDMIRALNNTMKLFGDIAKLTAELLNYNYPKEVENYSCEQFKKFHIELSEKKG